MREHDHQLPFTTRRGFIRLATTGVLAGAGAAFLAACGSRDAPAAVSQTPSPPAFVLDPDADAANLCPPLLEIEPQPPAALLTRTLALPSQPRQDRRLVLPGTPWETPLYINRSAAEGRTVFVLGGVHGNEPGGWAAAGQIADWMPDRGTLVVLPRANVLAIEAGERTLPELGDLNRFYPGEPPESANAFPMQLMASAIVDLLREFEVGMLLDLHESWAFFNERSQDGTAYLGQTITNGADVAESHRTEAIAAEVNEFVTEREQFTIRDRNRFSRIPDTTNRNPAWPTGGTSSLGIARFVDGVIPVLVEMGQQNQPESRRSELHQLVVRTALHHQGLLDR